MLAIAEVVGLLLLLLKEIGAISLSHTVTVLIIVVCLAIAVVGGFAGNFSFKRN